jgi:hypothetical protein
LTRTSAKPDGHRLTPAHEAYRDLRELRNTLAHGSRSGFGEIQRITASKAALRAFLGERLNLVRNLNG